MVPPDESASAGSSDQQADQDADDDAGDVGSRRGSVRSARSTNTSRRSARRSSRASVASSPRESQPESAHSKAPDAEGASRSNERRASRRSRRSRSTGDDSLRDAAPAHSKRSVAAFLNYDTYDIADFSDSGFESSSTNSSGPSSTRSCYNGIEGRICLCPRCLAHALRMPVPSQGGLWVGDRGQGVFRMIQTQGEGGLGMVGSRPHPDLRDHGRRPSLRVTTGPAGARLSGLKACRTADRPRTPRWHTREGDAAVPVCVGRACCLCVWGESGRGYEARRVTRQRRAWPGLGPVCLAGGGSGLGAAHSAGLWGGGGDSVLPLPALQWHNAGTSQYVGGRLLSCCSRREGPPMGHTCCGVHQQRATGIRCHGLGQRQGAVPRGHGREQGYGSPQGRYTCLCKLGKGPI